MRELLLQLLSVLGILSRREFTRNERISERMRAVRSIRFEEEETTK